MNRTTVEIMATVFVVAWSSIASAQAFDHAQPSSSHPSTEISSPSAWVASDEAVRPAVDHATLRLRLSLPGAFGSWASPPSAAGSPAVSVVGGEVGLSSRLSLLLEGAQNSFDSRSGMATGLRLHLLPIESPLGLSLSSGVMRDLGGGSAFFQQLNLTHDAGIWHFAGQLRANAFSSDVSNQPWLSGSGGVSLDVSPSSRLGLEYGFDRGVVSRSTLLPWVDVASKNRRVVFRAAGAVPLTGESTFPARFSLIGNF